MSTDPIEFDPPEEDEDQEALLPLGGSLIGKPLKAPTDGRPLDGGHINYNFFKMVSSPKYDGNRALILRGNMYTAQMREARNDGIRAYFSDLLDLSRRLDLMIDMEIYDHEAKHHAVTSGVLNSYDGDISPSTKAYVFDMAPMSAYRDQCVDYSYGLRLMIVKVEIDKLSNPKVVMAPQTYVPDSESALRCFEENIEAGYEGSILRATDIFYAPDGKPKGGWYKHGRATNKQHIMFKAKAYHTIDGVVLEFLPRRTMTADVERVRGPDGKLEPIRNKAAFEDTECVGAIKVRHRDPNSNELVTSEIGFGKGFDMSDRSIMWANRESLIGKWCEFVCMPHGAQIGGSARHGRLVRMRPDRDGDPV